MIIKTDAYEKDWIKSKQKQLLCKIAHIKKKCYNMWKSRKKINDI